MTDERVVTWLSKQAHFDYDKMLADTDVQGEYNIHCLTSPARWLLLTLVAFYGEYHNRFDGWPSIRDMDQIVAEATEGLVCPMTCEEDFQNLVTAVQAMAVSLEEINGKLGDEEADLDAKIETVGDNVALLTAELDDWGLPDLIDKLEPMLNGVGVILGAPTIPLNGA